MVDKAVRRRVIAFVVVMSALSNVLGLFVIPTGPMTLHLIQLPIVFSRLVTGAIAGGVVGFFGAFVMVGTLGVLLIEDLINAPISRLILYRIDVKALLASRKDAT